MKFELKETEAKTESEKRRLGKFIKEFPLLERIAHLDGPYGVDVLNIEVKAASTLLLAYRPVHDESVIVMPEADEEVVAKEQFFFYSGKSSQDQLWLPVTAGHAYNQTYQLPFGCMLNDVICELNDDMSRLKFIVHKVERQHRAIGEHFHMLLSADITIYRLKEEVGSLNSSLPAFKSIVLVSKNVPQSLKSSACIAQHMRRLDGVMEKLQTVWADKRKLYLKALRQSRSSALSVNRNSNGRRLTLIVKQLERWVSHSPCGTAYHCEVIVAEAKKDRDVLVALKANVHLENLHITRIDATVSEAKTLLEFVISVLAEPE